MIQWPWAIVLCKFNDKPGETRPRDFYEDFFTRIGTGGICDYWHVVSSGAIDLTPSKVFGWFVMNHASVEVSQLHFPGERWKLVQWGIDAANANGVPLGQFKSILIIHNFGLDHGFAGNGVVIAHQNTNLIECGFICHEMGHGHGLPHSWSALPDYEYGDGWDLMSFATTTFQFPYGFRGAQGQATVGLNARNLEALNAVPPGRMWSPANPDFSDQITLDPLNQPPIGNHGYLVAKIPPAATRPARGDGSAYTAEFRRKTGWDRAIPEDAVVIHQVRTDGRSFLVPTVWVRFTAGQQFTTPDPKVFVRIVTIDAQAETATIRLWDIPEGSLRKEDSKPPVYLIQNGMKRWVLSPAVLFGLGKTWADVRSVPDGGLSGVPSGPNLSLLNVSVKPYPMPVNRSLSVTVSATDIVSGASVAGDVIVDGVVIGPTNQAFTHTFRTRRVLVDPGPPRVFETVYPNGVVRAQDYPEVAIDFGFPAP